MSAISGIDCLPDAKFSKLLAEKLEAHWNKCVRDREDFDTTLECPVCGYDGEALEIRIAELEAEIEVLKWWAK